MVGVVTVFVDFPTSLPGRGGRPFGGALLGIVGALLAIPAAAAIQIVVREWLEYRREYGAA